MLFPWIVFLRKFHSVNPFDGNFCEPATKAPMGGHFPFTRAVSALLARILQWQASVLRAQLVVPSLLRHLVAPLPQTVTTTLVRRVRIEPGSLRNRWNVHLRLSAKCTLSYFLQFWFSKPFSNSFRDRSRTGCIFFFLTLTNTGCWLVGC